MEDIITKLHLIDYQTFCRVSERKPINRFYFAVQDTNCEANDQQKRKTKDVIKEKKDSGPQKCRISALNREDNYHR